MHRIDADGNILGQFTDGNPAIGQRATQVDAAYLNSVQEELSYVIEQAGIVLDKEDTTQLRQALVALITGLIGGGGGGGGGGGDVPSTRTITGSGLVTGGGDLAADRVLSVAAASAAEALAMVLTNKALTPASLTDLFGLTTGAGTFVARVGPLILMKASGTALDGTSVIVTLPDTFPNACLGAWANGGRAANDEQDNGPWVNGVGLSTVSVYSGINTSTAFQVFAIGY